MESSLTTWFEWILEFLILNWDETFYSALELLPRTGAETFCLIAAVCQIVGYYLYGKHVLGGETRPNIASWGMWFFGAVVDLVTYDSIRGSHWTTNAAPFACSLGVLGVTLIILYLHVRSRMHGIRPVYQTLEKGDKYFSLFDVSAAIVWMRGYGTLGNFISVGTTVFQFFPMYRETYKNPSVEKPDPWIWWSFAWGFMVVAVAVGPGADSWALYFLPLWYLMLHAIMVPLCLRKVPQTACV